MEIAEIRSALTVVLAEVESGEFNTLPARENLRRCKFALIGMTAFKQINPGDQIPQIRMDLVEARNSVERAIEALDQGDIEILRNELQHAFEQIRDS